MSEVKKFIFGETLEQAIDAIPEEFQLKFFRFIKDYGLHGIEPELTGFELATWVQMKAMINLTMPKKNNGSPISKVGAPFGNKNAQKTTNNNQNNQNNSSELIPKNNYKNNLHNLLNGNDNVNGNGNDEKQLQQIILDIKTRLNENGFSLNDSDIEGLISKTDTSWFCGYSFIDFISKNVREAYVERPQQEQLLLFRKLLYAQNLRDEYPKWREIKKEEEIVRSRKEMLEILKKTPPQKCECGGALENRGEYCVCTVDKTHGFYELDKNLLEWVFKK